MANANRLLVDVMKTFSFGVELETVGANRGVLAAAIATVTGGTAAATFGQGWAVTMADGRVWRVVADGSLTRGLSAEVVTPKLQWDDMELLQQVTRALFQAGARVDASCGVHVHVGVTGAGTSNPDLDGAALGRLAALCFQQEALLFVALKVAERRRGYYCREVSNEFIQRMVETRPKTRDELFVAWYGDAQTAQSARSQHRHQSRYRGLNLHSVQWHGTAEFRYFDGTLHAGKIKAYVQLCLALVTKAYVGKRAMARKRVYNPATSHYDTRVFLLRLGLIGDVFATARLHLTGHLEGSASRNGGGAARTRKTSAAAVDDEAPAIAAAS